MNGETKTLQQDSVSSTCQNCKNQFTIEPDDFAFYEKINVPAPTRCPECRQVQRMAFRNDRNLYKRTCDALGHTEEIFSIHSPDVPIKVYDHAYWYSDDWDPMKYGREYDFSVTFFKQMKDLMYDVPWFNLFRGRNAENSPYTNNVGDLKNCYLVFHAGSGTEDCYYSQNLIQCKNIVDSLLIKNSELCYECVNCIRCFRGLYSIDCEDSTDISFCKNCHGCSNCFGCVNLRSKQYYFFNEPYSKDGYAQKLREFDIGSYKDLSYTREKAEKLFTEHILKYMHGRHNQNISGDYINYSKNAFGCFDVRDVENSKYCNGLDRGPISECYDYTAWGNNATLIYDCLGCGHDVSELQFSFMCKITCSNLRYCAYISTSSNLFGCMSLRSKEYCILNKQYSKKEYEELVPKIINHMNEMFYTDRQGRVYKYGEFFPPELSPFVYNETIAQEYFPLSKEKAEKQGYRWKEPEERYYEVTRKPEDLPDHIKDIKDDILKEVIGCEHQNKCNEQCTTAFKIIKDELQFYRKTNLPLPRLCPNCRHYQRLKQRNPFKFWRRQCICDYKIYKNTVKHFHHPEGRCPNEFETSYAPERGEIVYCEECYNAEVV